MMRPPKPAELGPARVVKVLEVRERADADGRDLIVLDWVGDGSVAVPARHNRDMPVLPTRGEYVLAVLVGRAPFVVCRATAGPPVS